MSLVLSTLAVASGTNVALANVCGVDDEFVSVSGVVENGDQNYSTWVEVAVGVDDQEAGWLPHLQGSPVQTAMDGTFSIDVPCSIEYWDFGNSELVMADVTKFQVFAFPDLTTWDGSSAPSVGYSAGSIVPLANYSESQTVQMQAPTIWAFHDGATDFYFLYQAPSYHPIALLPAHSPSTDGVPLSAVNRGKMAAAYPFAAGDYRVRGYADGSDNYYDEDFASEFVLSFDRTVTNGGSFGEVESPNFYAALAYPAGREPVEDPVTGQWSSYPSIYLVNLSGNCATEWQQDQSCFESFDLYENDKIVATLESGVNYALAAQFSVLSMQTLLFQVLQNGSIAWVPGDSEEADPTVRGPATLEDPLVLQLEAPKLFIEVLEPDTTPAEGIDLQANACSDRGDGRIECYEWVPTQQPSGGTDGLFGWSPSDGTWKITLNNAWDYEYDPDNPDGDNWAWTPYYVKVETGVDGVTAITAMCAYTMEAGLLPACDLPAPQLNEEIDAHQFEVSRANVIVRVVDKDDLPYGQGSVTFAPAGSDSFDGTGVSSRGYVGLNLSAGDWEIVAEPSRSDLDQAAVRVEISAVDLAGASVENPLVVTAKLQEPNLQGRVLRPGGEASRYSYVGVQVWNAEENRPDHLRGSQTDGNGFFSINLEAGVYRLMFEAPPSDPNLPRMSGFVAVGADGSICGTTSFAEDPFADEDPSPCLDLESDEQGFVFRFPNANFSGTVVDENGDGVSGWLGASQWDGFEWDWSVDISADVKKNGTFSLFLPEDEFFLISIEPRASSGAARQEVFVYVSDSGWCVPEVQVNWPKEPSPCTAGQTGPFPIELPGANFYGSASDGSRPVANGWVDVAYETDYGFQGFTGGQVLRDGSFRVRIERPGTSWVRVRVTVNPPWGSSDLVKTSEIYWVKDDQICDQEAQPGESCPSASVVTRNTVQTFTLDGGNVRGTIFLPDVDASGDPVPAPFVHVSVEKQNLQGWWEWVDTWAQSDSQGRYSLGLTDFGNYRITARPFGMEGVSPTSIELTVDAGCSACDQADIALSPPNVRAVIRNASGDPVPRAWVAVERKVVDGFGNTWWEWTGRGDESDVNGDVSIFVPVTEVAETYRLQIHGPWGGLVVYPMRTSSEFALEDVDGSREKVFAAGDTDFRAGNVNVKLYDSSGTNTVPNAWVSIEAWDAVEKRWEWTGIGTNTSVNGEASLYLPACDPTCTKTDFRVIVESPWGSSLSYPRFSLRLDVVEAMGEGTFDELSYPSSNVDGQVWMDVSTFNTNGFVEIFDADSGFWVAGVPLNQQGKFSVYLDNGSYRFRVRAGGSSTASPIDMEVTIADNEMVGNVMTDCVLASGPSCSTLDPDPVNNTQDIEVSFGEVEPNLRIVVTRPGEADISEPIFVSITENTTGKVRYAMTDSVGVLEIDVPAGTYVIQATLALSDGTVSSETTAPTPIALTGNDPVEIELPS